MKAKSPAHWLKLAAIFVPATAAAFLVVAAIVWILCQCTLGQLPDFSNGG